jgi:hypothetical protein
MPGLSLTGRESQQNGNDLLKTNLYLIREHKLVGSLTTLWVYYSLPLLTSLTPWSIILEGNLNNNLSPLISLLPVSE